MSFLLIALLAVTLSWQDNSDNEDGFRVYRQLVGGTFETLGTTAPNVPTFQDANGVPGACYKVTAFNLAGESGPSNTVCLPLPPTAPSSLRFESVK